MELSEIDTFVTVAEEKSFSRAGKKLLRTQPAVSLTLKRLESELGEKLIDRSSKEPVLTDAGRLVPVIDDWLSSLPTPFDFDAWAETIAFR